MYWRFERLLDQWAYRKVFPTAGDIETYKRVKFTPEALDDPAMLRVRLMGRSRLACRPGTTDAKVLWDAFYHQFHMPPKRLRGVKCIVDLGANVGYTAAHLAQQYPDARVIAVEMNEQNAEICEQNLAPFGDRCRLIRAAVWSEDGEIRYGGNEDWSFRVVDLATTPPQDLRVARAIRLETLLEECGINHVDYMKMDIEGAEAVVLQDAKSWATRVDQMKIELHPPASFEDSAQNLADCGFVCQKDPDHPNGLIASKPCSDRGGR